MNILGTAEGNLTAIDMPPNFTEGDNAQATRLLLSTEERHRLLERAFIGLYRWYVSRSQAKRNWNADAFVNWQEMRTDHSPDVALLIEGFFAVEQYAPDYTSEILQLVRRSHGRSHFQLRWGAEEERHANTWENALLFSRSRTPRYIDDYKRELKNNNWTVPWDDPLHMMVYTVFQERATQVNYLNFAQLSRGQAPKPGYEGEADLILERACTILAVDEAAHYYFFLEGARLYLYYFPEETLQAILDVILHFAMPAQNIIPNWSEISEIIYKTGVYGPREFQRNVIVPALKNLSVEGKKALEAGLKRSREVPDRDGIVRTTAFWDTFDPRAAEGNVINIYDKIHEYEQLIGRDMVDPTLFVPNPDWPQLVI
jgi:acyl-[acyl-carrier-protein] desaturase